jgi:hypothetical protein
MARAFGIERSQTLSTVGVFFQTGMHRAHQHAVFERCEPQIEGANNDG